MLQAAMRKVTYIFAHSPFPHSFFVYTRLTILADYDLMLQFKQESKTLDKDGIRHLNRRLGFTLEFEAHVRSILYAPWRVLRGTT